MDWQSSLSLDLNAEHIAVLLAVAVFSVAMLASHGFHRRESVRRRAVATPASATGRPGHSRATRLLEHAARWAAPTDRKTLTATGKKLVQAGFFSDSAVKAFYALRLGLAAGLASIAILATGLAGPEVPTALSLWLAACAAAVGLILPPILLDFRVGRMRGRYRRAFPDFMDLLVVCVQAGQSLQGAIARVSGEMIEICPQLGANLHLVSLELRAGSTLTSALSNLHVRLGIDEVQSLALLLKQAEELGTSISSALRIYSDEMRDKRLLRAETKANSLPVKMTVPLGLFIFPVILIVILTPVVIRIKSAFM